MNVGENIRKIRKLKDMTMKELGNKIGISEQGVGNYERGDRQPSIETLNKIAESLGVSPNQLYGSTNEYIGEFKTFSNTLDSSDQEYVKSIKSLYELLEQIKTGGFWEENIESNIIKTGLDNYKRILSLDYLKILNASLMITILLKKSIDNPDIKYSGELLDNIEKTINKMFHQ